MTAVTIVRITYPRGEAAGKQSLFTLTRLAQTAFDLDYVSNITGFSLWLYGACCTFSIVEIILEYP